jgi:hypothetical protein
MGKSGRCLVVTNVVMPNSWTADVTTSTTRQERDQPTSKLLDGGSNRVRRLGMTTGALLGSRALFRIKLVEMGGRSWRELGRVDKFDPVASRRDECVARKLSAPRHAPARWSRNPLLARQPQCQRCCAGPVDKFPTPLLQPEAGRCALAISCAVRACTKVTLPLAGRPCSLSVSRTEPTALAVTGRRASASALRCGAGGYGRDRSTAPKRHRPWPGRWCRPAPAGCGRPWRRAARQRGSRPAAAHTVWPARPARRGDRWQRASLCRRSPPASAVR